MLIQVTLDSETPGDLERFFDLLTGFGGKKLEQNINTALKPAEPTGEPLGSAAFEPDHTPEPESKPVTEQPKRHRRTKAEMEAARAQETAPIEQAATQPAEQPAPSTATQLPPATEQPAASISTDDLRSALQGFTSAKGMPAGIELLKKFGCSRISELAAKDDATKRQFVAEAA